MVIVSALSEREERAGYNEALGATEAKICMGALSLLALGVWTF